MPDVERNYVDSSVAKKQLGDVWKVVSNIFEYEKRDQSDWINRFWDIYNCVLNENQSYSGTSHVFVPAVRDAIEARVKRFQSMLFPKIGNQIDVISESGDRPDATVAVLEHYVLSSKLENISPALLRTGDVEGQWSLEVMWSKKETIARRVRQTFDHDSQSEVLSLQAETVVHEGPRVEVVAAQDLGVHPATAECVDDAEIVVRRLWLTDGGMNKHVDEGWFDKEARGKAQKSSKRSPGAARAADAGQRLGPASDSDLYCVYKIWCDIRFPGEKEKTPAIVFMTSANNVLGIHVNQYWSRRVPIVSAPVEKIAGSFWGKSKIAHVEQMQYLLNDMINEGSDSAGFSVMPIVMTDPVKNPMVSSMILGLGAIWQTNPNDTQFVEFPPLWQHAFQTAAAIKMQIMESMDVNESMLGAAPRGRKNAQAIAQESQAAMASIVDTVRRLEAEIFTPLLEWFYELDQQFRDDELLIMQTGRIGMQAKIERIAPFQLYERYWFKWNGSEQMMGAQRIQQMIAFMNVARGIPPQQLGNRRLDIGPILDFIAESVCGPVMKGEVLIDMTKQGSMDPHMEDEIMVNGIALPVHPTDNDVDHIKDHQETARATGDPHATIRAHIMEHVKQMRAKTAMLQPPAGGMPGVPGGEGPGGGQPAPGVAGTPRPGAVPGAPRGVQNPAGAVHPDHMVDAAAMPRG